MGRIASALLLLVLALCCAVAMVKGYNHHEGGEGGERRGRERMFLLRDMKRVVRTEAGEMKVVRSTHGWISDWPNIHVGFVTMEPNSLFIPQYLDSDLILFIRRGEARVGSIYRDELIEKRLNCGDVYRIPAGSTFYLVNTADGQQLHVICSIEKSDSIGWGTFQSFFIGGGSNPTSILAGFERSTLSTALNVLESQVRQILARQKSGPIISLSNSHQSRVWTQFLGMKHYERVRCLKRMAQVHEEATEQDEEPIMWKLLNSVFGNQVSGKDEGRSSKPDSYNLFDRTPDFENDYGSSVAVDQSAYSPLRRSGVGLYLVNLTAGSMMAPHLNPTATEYGIVLRGSGKIQIVFPNGTLAMNAKVNEGDVFWIPRYFPFCQIASHSGPFEFFGFTTSARRNRPQFLVGSNSVLQSMRGPAFAAAFGVSEERLERIVNAQSESTILPSGSASAEKVRNERIPEVIRSFGDEMVMGF
ncbi:vicilin-like seed storage protein At2g28490 isoform X2 [Rhododendron vialii]|uniref:vicilin-like seed storage protein At2g28490 isoform X2 n=1 Tax=Rhododendron vialii TaxID=182163 RepID=UPI00265FD332|nr:vicilin-like seed storage protein At2g28490 isoform X2 [Rhododendron vialii]